MAKCSKCSNTTAGSRAMYLAFVAGQPVYACSKHRSKLTIDPITDWMRIGRITQVSDALTAPRLNDLGATQVVNP